MADARRYSWTKFGLGIIAGMSALSTLTITPPHFYLAMSLLFTSTVLLTQGPDEVRQPEPFISDADEWRKLGRGFVHDLPRTLINVAVIVGLTLLCDAAVSRYPFLQSTASRKIWVPILFAAAWIPNVIAAYRRGKSRNQRAQVFAG